MRPLRIKIFYPVASPFSMLIKFLVKISEGLDYQGNVQENYIFPILAEISWVLNFFLTSS